MIDLEAARRLADELYAVGIPDKEYGGHQAADIVRSLISEVTRLTALHQTVLDQATEAAREEFRVEVERLNENVEWYQKRDRDLRCIDGVCTCGMIHCAICGNEVPKTSHILKDNVQLRERNAELEREVCACRAALEECHYTGALPEGIYDKLRERNARLETVAKCAKVFGGWHDFNPRNGGGTELGMALDALNCVCHETSSRNCPIHGNAHD